MSADSPINVQWPDDEQQDSSKAYALSGKIMLASIITLFVVVGFLLLLHLYARWYLLRLHRRNDTRPPNPRNPSTRLVYYVDTNRALASGSSGLDASVLKSLPLFVFSSENMPECAVCLSEFEKGETGRVLPNCKHSFHTGCIDMWFQCHSTCPLCRSPVEPVQTQMTELESVPEPGSSTSLSSPVQRCTELFETTSSADRRKRIDVRIDVPVNESVAENEFRLPSPSQGFRSPGSRLLSLKRIINMSRNLPVVSPSPDVGPSSVPVATESDVESGRQESSRRGTLR